MDHYNDIYLTLFSEDLMTQFDKNFIFHRLNTRLGNCKIAFGYCLTIFDLLSIFFTKKLKSGKILENV
jgi:hypothetical protein